MIELERTITDTLKGCLPHDWHEDFITRELMRAFRNLFQTTTIKYSNFEKIVQWQSYKNTGNLENSFGDISLIICIQFSTGETLKGVAFIEAKKEYPSNKFEATKMDQLVRIHDNAPYSYLLYYLRNYYGTHSNIFSHSKFCTLAMTTPINTAIAKIPQLPSVDDLSVLRITHPFSSQLASRYFWGLDLEYGDDAIKKALEGPEGASASKYLGVIDVFYKSQEPNSQIELTDEWEPIK